MLKTYTQLSRYCDGLEAERPWFDFHQEQEIFLYSTASRLALGPTQWAISPTVKRPGREADHSPLSSAGIKNGKAVPPLPDTPSRCGA
jgi:hypothetical protein